MYVLYRLQYSMHAMYGTRTGYDTVMMWDKIGSTRSHVFEFKKYTVNPIKPAMIIYKPVERISFIHTPGQP